MCADIIAWGCAVQRPQSSASMAQRVSTRTSAASEAVAPQPSAGSTGTFIERSFVNSTPARLAALLGAVALGGFGTSFLPLSGAIAVVHILAAGIWVGVNFWTTFGVPS